MGSRSIIFAIHADIWISCIWHFHCLFDDFIALNLCQVEGNQTMPACLGTQCAVFQMDCYSFGLLLNHK